MRLRKRQRQQQQQHEIVGGSTNAAAELIGALASRPGHGLAYVDSLGVIERVRFADVARRTAEWAELVREHDVQPGDRVIVLAERDREWRFALLGVIMAGGVAVPFPASTPARELRAIASDANAVLFVSARARLDLAAPDGPRALSSDDLERRHKALAAQHVPHLAMPADVALIDFDHGPDDLRGAVHTHASLAEGAEVAERRLGVRAGERLWSTVANGSIESIWLLLGAWRVGAEIVDVDHPFDVETELELLARFQPATVWFSDEEYAALAVVTASEWIEPGSIRCALTSREAADGATAFAHSFGATVVTADMSQEIGVRPVGEPPAAEQGSGDVFEGADPKLLAALAAAVVPDAPAAAPSSREEAKLRKQAERAAAEERRRVEAAERAQRESVAAEERERAEETRREDERAREEAKRQKEAERVAAEERKDAAAAERHRAEEEKRIAAERKRETAKIRKLAEREAAKERSPIEEEERARREAAAAAERKRAEEEKRREAERARQDAKARKEAEREAEKAKRAEREAEAAADRARVEEEKRREAARAQADAKTRKEAERQAEKERRRAEEQERAERAAAAAAERKRLEDEKRREAEREREEAKSRKLAERAAAKERRRVEGERTRKRQRDAEERAERERLAPDILASISQYGIGASSAESGRRDGETATGPSAAPTPDTRRDA
jgi:acyl-CoA synthetase (AMP-forming)/AMP-acid ligase II